MALLITMSRFPAGISVQETSKVFDERGGSIGRSSDNTWVLEDPERFLSSHHSRIIYSNGQFFLEDSSTNGTFLNGAPEPVGKGNRLPLNDGDQFDVGDYQFSVSVAESAAETADSPFAVPPVTDIFAPNAASGSDVGVPSPVAQQSSLTDPFALTGGGSELLLEPDADVVDPLAALDQAQHSQQATPVFADSQADNAGGMQQALQWPTAKPEAGKPAAGLIPEDWEDDLLAQPNAAAPVAAPPANPNTLTQPNVAVPAAAPPIDPNTLTQPNIVAPAAAPPVDPNTLTQPNVATPVAAPPPVNTGNLADPGVNKLRQANQEILAELAALKQQIQQQPKTQPTAVAPTATTPAAATATDQALLQALGLEDQKLNAEQMQMLAHTVGEVAREAIAGMIPVLNARDSIRNNFRMHVTTIQPMENNPLQFSANVDEAILNMFVRSSKAYKNPVQAMRDSFASIAEHQMAVLAGMRSAFNGIVERFDPQRLAQQFEQQHKSSWIPSGQKAKCWEAYCEYFKHSVQDTDSSFQSLFGDEFVKAYEDQLQKLLLSRPQKSTDPTLT